MSFLTGKTSFSVFSVSRELPSIGEILDKIRAFSFKDIDDTFDEYSVGWVSVLDEFDTSKSLITGDYVTISLRIDERKISSSILKKFVRKEEKRIMEERQIPRLSRAAKVEIKERIKVELMRKTKPSLSLYDVVWNLTSGKLLFFTTNTKAKAIFEAFFKATFSLTVTQDIPFTIGTKKTREEWMNNLAPLAIA